MDISVLTKPFAKLVQHGFLDCVCARRKAVN